MVDESSRLAFQLSMSRLILGQPVLTSTRVGDGVLSTSEQLVNETPMALPSVILLLHVQGLD